jgi:methionine-S-sulfoxide reductase
MAWEESLRQISLVALGLVLWTLFLQVADPKETNGSQKLRRATFAGGCFWCMEPVFEGIPGVLETKVGYTGGHVENPTYEEVCSGKTGHFEAIQLLYDPEKVSYEELVKVFLRNIDPTDPDGQFCDRGPQYRTAIFYHDEAQKAQAEKVLRELSDRGLFKEIHTQLLPEATFWPAEDYHQKFYRKNPLRYAMYKMGCRREERLVEIWKDGIVSK